MSTTATNQRIAAKFTGREVYFCVSTLVSELAQKAEEFPEYTDDIYDLCRGLPDYESALIDNGWESFSDKYGVACWRDTSDGATHCGTAEDVYKFFEDDLNFDVGDYESEIFEHWIVSEFLANRLEAKGERVVRDFFGLTVWGRPTTGQGISSDRVIEEICHDMEILEGQKHSWAE